MEFQTNYFFNVHYDDYEELPEKQFHFRCMSPLPGSQFSGNAVKSQFVRVSLLGKGNIFGEHDAVLERNYTTSVRCFSTSGKLLKIKIADFIQFLKSTNPKSLNTIKNTVEEVNEHVSKFLKTMRKIEFTSKLHMMNYTDNKIEEIAEKIIDDPLEVFMKHQHSKEEIRKENDESYSKRKENISFSQISQRMDGSNQIIKRIPYSKLNMRLTQSKSRQASKGFEYHTLSRIEKIEENNKIPSFKKTVYFDDKTVDDLLRNGRK